VARSVAGIVAIALGVTLGGSVVPGGVQTTGQPKSSAFLLARTKAGNIEIGATVDEVYGLAGRSNVRLVAQFNEGFFTPVLEVSMSGASADPAFILEIREWPCPGFSVWAIQVLDSRFRTQEGLGVGSTLGELRRAFKLEVGVGEGSQYAFAEALQMSFGFVGLEPLTDSSTVKSVRLVPDPVGVRLRRCLKVG
jgi:hypothetical protein